MRKPGRRCGSDVSHTVALEAQLQRTPERRSAAGVKSSAVRLIPNLSRFADLLVSLSKPFNVLSRGRSGFHMVIEGVDGSGAPVIRRHWIIARSGHGPNIPVIPPILIVALTMGITE